MSELSRCDVVGAGVRVFGRLQVDNQGRIEIGARVTIHAEPVRSHLATGPHGLLRIGDGVVIDHGAGIAAHLSVTIGARAHLGPYVLVMDTNFHRLGDMGQVPQPRAISIGEDAVIGANSTVLRGAQIGAGVRALAGSVISGVVAPGALIAGVPAVDLRRVVTRPAAGLEDAVLIAVQEAFHLGAPPLLSTRRDEIEEWDTLGTLRLVAALEQRLGTSIDPEQLAAARSVAEVLRTARSLNA